MVIAPEILGKSRYNQTNTARSLPDNFGLFGVFPPQDVQLMAKDNDLSLQAFMRLEAAPDIPQQKVYEVQHRI